MSPKTPTPKLGALAAANPPPPFAYTSIGEAERDLLALDGSNPDDFVAFDVMPIQAPQAVAGAMIKHGPGIPAECTVVTVAFAVPVTPRRFQGGGILTLSGAPAASPLAAIYGRILMRRDALAPGVSVPAPPVSEET
jgi:hypothetical protein